MQIVEIYLKTTSPWSPCWHTLYFWRVPVVQYARNQNGSSTHITALYHIWIITKTQQLFFNNNTIKTAISSSTVSNTNAIFNNTENVLPTLPTISLYCDHQHHLQQHKTHIPPSPSSNNIVWVQKGTRWQKIMLRYFLIRKKILKYHIL